MTLETINALTIEDVRTELEASILSGDELLTLEDITQAMLESALADYKQALILERQSHIDAYHDYLPLALTKPAIDFTSYTTDAIELELLDFIAADKLERAKEDYLLFEPVMATKPDLDWMDEFTTAEDVINLLESIKNSDAYMIEQERQRLLKERFDSLNEVDVREAMRELDCYEPNLAHFRNVELMKDDSMMDAIEAKALEHKAKREQLENKKRLYDVMVADIYAEMYRVFGTNSDASAQATASTWEAMQKRPANYIGTMNFTTEAEIIAYAESKLLEADNYGKYRINRIEQYRQEVAST